MEVDWAREVVLSVTGSNSSVLTALFVIVESWFFLKCP